MDAPSLLVVMRGILPEFDRLLVEQAAATGRLRAIVALYENEDKDEAQVSWAFFAGMHSGAEVYPLARAVALRDDDMQLAIKMAGENFAGQILGDWPNASTAIGKITFLRPGA